mgnify:CR=1 FL=1
MSKLDEICATTRAEVARRKAGHNPIALAQAIAEAGPPRGFRAALERKVAAGAPALIAEIKQASPSKGLIRDDFDPAAHARAYAAGGAACLSVLTDTPYFMGADEYLVAARAACELPALRKDFMVDIWQIDESRSLGADAVLLIVAALGDDDLHAMHARARRLGMDVLVEVHDRDEFDRALAIPDVDLIGVNNRDLRSFTTDIALSERLAPLAPPGVSFVSESGIAGPGDIARLRRSGIHSFLVGEHLMRQADLCAAVQELFHESS